VQQYVEDSTLHFLGNIFNIYMLTVTCYATVQEELIVVLP